MNCKQCNNSIQPDWKVCPFCSNPLSKVCNNCSFELQPDWKACPACGTRVIATSSATSAQHSKTERLCGTSGKPIREQDDYFKCHDCQEFHHEQYRFIEGEAICKTCAHQDGSAEAYEKEQQRKAKAEADRRAEIHKKLEAEYQSKLKQEQERISKQVSKPTQDRITEWALKHGVESQQILDKSQEIPITDDDFVSIPAGRYTTGSPEYEEGHISDERQQTLYVDAFMLMKHPVTFAQYEKYCQQVGIDVPDDNGFGKGHRPVINVSPLDLIDFCLWLSKQSRHTYRLPTEAEWEYAARAGTTSAYHYGDKADKKMMHYDASHTLPVGTFPANPWGLFDMHGNVWEWCTNEYNKDYSGKEEQDASGGKKNNSFQAIRGGSYCDDASLCRSARGSSKFARKHHNVGLRIARTQ